MKLTAPVDISHLLLPRITNAYLARYPGTTVELRVSNHFVDLIGEGIDLAIRAGMLKDSSLIAQRFFDVSTSLWTSPEYLKQLGKVSHPRDLANASFVELKGIGSLQLTNGKSKIELTMVSRFVADDLEAIKAFAVLGKGIAWLPDFLAADAAQAGRLGQVLPTWKLKEMGNVHFIYAGRKYTSHNVQACIQVPQETLGITTSFRRQSVATAARITV